MSAGHRHTTFRLLFFCGRHLADALKSQYSFLTTRTMRISRLISLLMFYMSVAVLAFYTKMC